MEKKENDLILNMLANPEFTLTDFQSVGLSGDNTNLLSEEQYKASDKINKNENFLDSEGRFDEAKFHNFYILAGLFYNLLATEDYEKSILDNALFSLDNMWVEPTKRNIDYSPKLTRSPNEFLVSNSLTSIGKKGERTLSTSEIAQTLQIYDTASGQWKESPNDSFFSNFFNTLVLASYDLDEVDPETGEVLHKKGLLKLNDAGLPYYETLGGRDVAGKLVLNKMNCITTDGSFANKFDFFDSDDIDQKSVGGTILKNAALVGSMFVPYLGPVVTGLSVASQTAGLLATMSKLILGNDIDTLNNIEGWAKTVNRSASTEYASTHTWCGENFLNMIGDTVGLLAELRWIFKAAPTLLTGNNKVWKAMSSLEGRELVIKLVLKDLLEKNAKLNTENILKQIQSPEGIFNLERYQKEIANATYSKAVGIVDDLIKKGTKWSSPISKAYMTGITVLDTYGEAKLAGASDLEASLLTTGYAAMEAILLNTGLGEWILPELKGNNFRFNAISKALNTDMKKLYETYQETGSKQSLVKGILNLGKKIAKNDYAELAAGKGIKSGLSVVGAHALGESFEEVSEEVLADFSKSLFNVTRWLRGLDSLEMGQWENMGDRYLMSALGGFFGGGITSAATDFNVARNLATMDKTKAMLELLYIINNDQEGDFLKSLDKITLGNKNLSASKLINNEGDHPIWAAAEKDDNQDLVAKDFIKKQVKLVKDILNSEGARISTDSMLNNLTMEDRRDLMKNIRFLNLKNTQSIGMYLLDFQNLQSEIVKLNAELLALDFSKKDSEKDTELDEKKRKELTEQLNEKRKELKNYKEGNIAPQAIRDALFEMNPLINGLHTNLILYAEHKYGKKWSELSDNELKEVKELYKNYSETEMKEDVHIRALAYLDMIELFTPAAQLQLQVILVQNEHDLKSIQGLDSFISRLLDSMSKLEISENTDEEAYFNNINSVLKSLKMDSIAESTAYYFTPDEIQQINDLNNFDGETPKLWSIKAKNKLYEIAVNKVDALVLAAEKIGYLNPETKVALKKILNFLQETADKYSTNLEYYDHLRPGRLLQAFIKMHKINSARMQALNKKVDNLKNTPVIDYLSKFQLSATNLDLNLYKHWEMSTKLVNDNIDDLSEISGSSNWEENNDEAIKLIDLFIAAIEGAKVDNAGLDNPTGYTRLLNNVYTAQGIKDYVPLIELDSEMANLIILDAKKIKDKLVFVRNISNLNKGLKLKQLVKVGTNINYLVFSQIKRLFNCIPADDWVGTAELDQAIQQCTNLEENYEERNLQVPKDIKEAMNAEMILLEDAIYDFFLKNKTSDGGIDSKKLGKLLNEFAGKGGFFQKTHKLLTESSENIDDNAFIWWMASRASLKSSAFNNAYLGAITENIAPIASQELAVYLGTAAITNCNVLNSFVDAYRETVILDFNVLSEEDRTKYLNLFDNSGVAYSKQLLKYFGGHDVLPQYKNMVFIEGIPGAGKSKGVFNMIKRVISNINPEYLNGAFYVHATESSAKQAVEDIGFNKPKIFNKESFMKYISSEWKNIENNNNFLYEDSYYFNELGLLMNKWKLNHYSDLPKVIFIDEITHYNLHELRMIEQFALENQIIVLTAGDTDLDTQEAKLKIKELKDNDIIVSINRNNFIRTPKLGVSLRTLNKLLTSSISTALAAYQQLIEGGNNLDIQFSYLDSDPNHKGLYGVKVYNPKNIQTNLTNEDVAELMPTIQLMIDTLLPEKTVNGKVIPALKLGYIYHDKNSVLYKKLMETYPDKIVAYQDTDALGLEGQYYIIEGDLSKLNLSDPSTSDYESYYRHLYTGISRAELGALVISAGTFWGISTMESTLDVEFLLETLKEQAIIKSALDKKEFLENYFEENYEYDDIKIIPPTKQIPKEIKSDDEKDPDTDGTLPPPIAPQTIPDRIGFGYTSKDKATEALEIFKTKIASLGKDIEILDSNNKVWHLAGLDIIESQNDGNTVYTPTLTLRDDSDSDIKVTLDEFNKEFILRNKQSLEELPLYNVGDKLQLSDGSSIKIVSIDKTSPVLFTVSDLDDSNIRLMLQSDIKSKYKGPVIEKVKEEEGVPDNGFENSGEEYKKALEGINRDKEKKLIYTGPTIHIKHRFYTHNTFEMGVRKSSKGTAIYDCPEEVFKLRIDSAIGLMHLLGNDVPYDILESIIATLNNEVLYEKDNSVLADKIKKILSLKGNVSIGYKIKNSSGVFDSDKNPIYYRYYIDLDSEDLSYIKSDDEKNAKKPMKLKVILLVKADNVPVFELPIASMNSPLTLMTLLDDDGKVVFLEILDYFNERLKFYGGDNKKNRFNAINDIITKFSNTKYQELIDLFKIWQFTSNGTLDFPEDFNMASNEVSGPVLVKRRGNKQLDGSLLYTSKLEDIAEFAKNPKLHVSSIFASKSGLIGNVRVEELHPAHSFVLISDSENFIDDQSLINLYIKLVNDPKEPKHVKIVYILPPEASISDWLYNKHNLYENISSGLQLNQIYDIGNDFTSYRIMQSLLNSGKFDTFKSSDDTLEDLIKYVELLDAIEAKWNEDTINFLSKEEEAEYKTLVTQIGELYARRTMRINELNILLNTPIKFKTVNVKDDKKLKDYFTSYLTNIVWFNLPEFQIVNNKKVSGKTTFKPDMLKAIEDACKASKKPLDIIYYKSLYSSLEIGPFIKIQTYDKYTLRKTPSGLDANFKIFAGILTSTIDIDNFSDIIRDLASGKYFYFDEKHKTWVLTSNYGKKSEEDYLNLTKHKTPEETEESKVEKLYKKYFDNGTLNKDILNKKHSTRKELIEELLLDFNSKRGNYGFVYNNLMVLTHLNNLDLLLLNPQTSIASLSPIKGVVLDSAGNKIDIEILFDIDPFTNTLNEVKCRCTNFKTVKINRLDTPNIDLNNMNELFNSSQAFLQSYGSVKRMPIKAYLPDDSNIENYIGKLVQKHSLVTLKAFLDKLNSVFDDLLNFYKDDEEKVNKFNSIRFELLKKFNDVGIYDIKALDILRINTKRFLVININGNDILCNEIDDLDNILNENIILTDTDKENMTKEELECSPVKWNII